MKKNASFIIINTSQVLTIASYNKSKFGKQMSDLGIVINGAVAIHNNKIVWVGPEKELHANIELTPHATKFNANKCCVMPGLVDCHTHLVFAGTREDEFAQKIAGVPYMEIAAQGGGIKRTVQATRLASIDELLYIGRERIREYLTLGITCLEIKSGYGLETNTEMKMLRVARELESEFNMEIPRTFLGAHEIPEDKTKIDYIQQICKEMIPIVSDENLAEFCDVFCEKGVYTPDEARLILSIGKNHRLSPKLHADQMTSGGGAQLAVEVNATSADHLDHIDDDGIKAMKSSRTIGVLLPGAVFFLGLNKYPPARKMIDSGMSIALATDFNPGSCMSQNLPLIMTIACTQCKMTIEEAFSACTINAAYAAGRGHLCGSLEKGKRADIVILDTPNYKTMPYHFAHNHVKHVICNGKIVVENFTYKP